MSRSGRRGDRRGLGRSASNPVAVGMGSEKATAAFRGYLPPLLEALGMAELTHDAKNNRMRAR